MKSSAPLTVNKLSLAVLAVLSMPAFAQATDGVHDEPVVDLGSLVVTAQRGNVKLKDSAQKVLIIDRQAISDQLLVNDDTSNALAKLIPGYAPATEKLGTVGESFRGRDVLFMVDGVPQSNPLRNGSRESRTIDLSMVERIEVVYGASAEQGLGATGGIINFITKSNRSEGLNHQVHTSLNTSQAFKAAGVGGDVRYQASFGNDSSDALLALKYAKEGMYYQADNRMMGIYGNQGDIMGSKSYDIFAKASHQLDDDKRIGASANYYRLEGSQNYVNVPGNRATGLTDTATPYDGTTEQGENPFNKVLTLNANYDDEDFFGTRLSTQAFYNHFIARYGANNAPNYQDPNILPNGKLLDQSQNESVKMGAKFAINKDDLWQDKLALTAGVDVLQDTTGQDLIRYQRVWAPKMVYRNVSPFVQARLRLLERLSLSAGVRYENGHLSVDDFKTLAGYTRHEKFGDRRWIYTPVQGGKVAFSQLLPSAGLVYDVMDNTQLFASYSRGLGMPDVGGTLRAITDVNRRVADVNLTPIITDNTELGVRFTGDKLSANISAFNSKSDMGSTLEYNKELERYVAKRQKTNVLGAEFGVRYQANAQTQINASYAHAQGKYDALGDGVMVEMPARNISPDKLSLGVDYRFADGDKRFGMTATHLFSRTYPHINNKPSKFAGYTVVDMTYRQPLGKGTIGLGVNNLFNQSYINYLTSAVLPTSDRFSGGRGRNYNISYRLDF